MRINLLIFGTRGDVQPALALGVGLKKAGLEVKLSTFEEFRSLVEEHGLDFVPLSANIREILDQSVGKRVFTGTALFDLIKLFRRLSSMMFTALWQASQGCDLLISNAATSMFVDAVAERMQIPHIETSVFPGWPTRAFPSFFGPWPPSLGAQSGGLTGQIKGAINWFLHTHCSQGRHDMLACNLTILYDPMRSLRNLLACQPSFYELLQTHLSAFIGQSTCYFGLHFLDPVTAFSLGLCILGKPPTIETHLGTPAVTVVAKVKGAFVIRPFKSHIYFPYLF